MGKTRAEKQAVERPTIQEIILFSILFVFIIILDQVTKELFYGKKAVYEFGWLTLHSVTNTGASFGMLQGLGTVLLVLSVVALGFIGWCFLRVSRLARIPLVFIAAGILGNLFNRISYGFVIDWIDLHWWPVFNAADSCIFVGVIWLVVIFWAEDAKTKKNRV